MNASKGTALSRRSILVHSSWTFSYMVGAAGLLLSSSVRFIGGLSEFPNSKQALNDGTTSLREMMELSTGRNRSVAF